MAFIKYGDKVRKYYDAECFDEGEVTKIDAGLIMVDFYDWIECWPKSAFMLREVFLEGIEVLEPVQHGVVVIDFRRT